MSGFVIGQQLPGCQHVEQAAQATGEAASQLSGHTGAIYSATYSPDARFIVTASWDGTVLASEGEKGMVRLWDGATGQALGELPQTGQGDVSDVAWRPDGALLASAGFVAEVDAELCAASGSCADYCQFAAISIDDGIAGIDGSAYMGCGVCVSKCPQ